MQVFANLAIPLNPACIYWDDEKPKAIILRDADTAKQYYADNELWEYKALIFAEDGTPIPPPPQPEKEA